jgi:hypothetical protein
MTWKRTAAFLLGVGVALLRKLTCPMCAQAYAGLLTTLGLGFRRSSGSQVPRSSHWKISL